LVTRKWPWARWNAARASKSGVIVQAVTIPTTLGVIYIFANFMDMAVYVTNIVTLIGLAIAIDYSMLIVFRYREELAHGDEPNDALVRAMSTAGRATVFSGMTVAVGLALLAFMVAWVAGLLLFGVALAWRAAAWTAESIRISRPRIVPAPVNEPAGEAV